MTDIEFHILASTDDSSRLRYCCQLSEALWRKGRQVHIHATNAEQAEQLDQLMWTFRDNSFVPHAQLNKTGAVNISIGYDEQQPASDDVMINLTHPVPDYFSRFHDVLEIVIEQTGIKQQTRDNYRFYQQRGYPLAHKKIHGDGLSPTI
ncbi:MAG: DNA polymerase III subunit chi [Pseudomonadales bacterium]